MRGSRLTLLFGGPVFHGMLVSVGMLGIWFVSIECCAACAEKPGFGGILVVDVIRNC